MMYGFSFITEREEPAIRNLAIVCEASLKQESFRRHVDRVFENYVFSNDSRTNMAVKAILYNCMTCEGDFSFDPSHKVWVRDTTDRYAFNEAMRKFNKILQHDRRFRGRMPWIIRKVREYFNKHLVRKYTALKPVTPTKPTPKPTSEPNQEPTSSQTPPEDAETAES